MWVQHFDKPSAGPSKNMHTNRFLILVAEVLVSNQCLYNPGIVWLIKAETLT